MKKTILLYFIFLLSGFLLSNGCGGGDPLDPNIGDSFAISDPVNEDGFAIYVFDDKSIKTNELTLSGFDFDSYIGKDIHSLNKTVNLWLSAKDIEFYDYSSHLMYLRRDKSFLFGDDYREPSGNFFVEYGLSPFIVTSGKTICFIGTFAPPVYSSLATPNRPHIDNMEVLMNASDIVHIRHGFGLGSVVDTRYNNGLITALKKDNIFKSGLELKLNDINIIKGDTFTVEYEFTVTNRDNEDLYFFDPEKMGVNVFNFYTNGIRFINKNNKSVIDRDYVSLYTPPSTPITPMWSYIDKSWFTLVSPGKSIKYKSSIKGYLSIPDGNYSCYFSIGPFCGISKNDRYIDGKRIWIGEIFSNGLSISYSKNGVIVNKM